MTLKNNNNNKLNAWFACIEDHFPLMQQPHKGLSSPTSLLSNHQLKVPAGGKAPTGGIAVRHVRRSHSGKFVRVKKGETSYCFGYLLMVIFFELFNSMHLFLLSPIWVFVL